MAGRGKIRAADIALVRERSKIDEVVGEHLQLKRAGGGSLKGLCPFHDEKSPSFHVTPTRQLWNCFGCGEGGDVITFVQKIDHLSFSEAVELLAGKVGVQLQYEDDGGRPTGAPDRGDYVILRDPGGLLLCVLPVQDAARFETDATAWD